MIKHLLIFSIVLLLAALSNDASAQDDKHKHYRFVYVENIPNDKHVILGVSDDGKKYEENKVKKPTSDSGTDFNEAIKLIQKYQDEGWILTRTQHLNAFKLYLIFEK